MNQNIAGYVEAVGKDKITYNLKYDLKTELTKAIATENWLLVKEITELIEKVFNDNASEDNQDLIRCVEIIGIQKSNINLKNYLIQAIESEEWLIVQEISEILDNYLDCDCNLEITKIKNLLKTILSKSIEGEDWHLAEQITDLLKSHYSLKSNSIIEREDTKKHFKQALNELIKVNKYDLTNEIVTVIQDNLVEYVREVEILKKETKALTEAYQLDSLKAEPLYPKNYRTVDVNFAQSSSRARSCNTLDLSVEKYSSALKYSESTITVETEIELEKADDVLETIEDLHNVVIFHLDETKS